MNGWGTGKFLSPATSYREAFSGGRELQALPNLYFFAKVTFVVNQSLSFLTKFVVQVLPSSRKPR